MRFRLLVNAPVVPLIAPAVRAPAPKLAALLPALLIAPVSAKAPMFVNVPVVAATLRNPEIVELATVPVMAWDAATVIPAEAVTKPAWFVAFAT